LNNRLHGEGVEKKKLFIKLVARGCKKRIKTGGGAAGCARARVLDKGFNAGGNANYVNFTLCTHSAKKLIMLRN